MSQFGIELDSAELDQREKENINIGQGEHRVHGGFNFYRLSHKNQRRQTYLDYYNHKYKTNINMSSQQKPQLRQIPHRKQHYDLMYITLSFVELNGICIKQQRRQHEQSSPRLEHKKKKTESKQEKTGSFNDAIMSFPSESDSDSEEDESDFLDSDLSPTSTRRKSCSPGKDQQQAIIFASFLTSGNRKNTKSGESVNNNINNNDKNVMVVPSQPFHFSSDLPNDRELKSDTTSTTTKTAFWKATDSTLASDTVNDLAPISFTQWMIYNLNNDNERDIPAQHQTESRDKKYLSRTIEVQLNAVIPINCNNNDANNSTENPQQDGSHSSYHSLFLGYTRIVLHGELEKEIEYELPVYPNESPRNINTVGRSDDVDTNRKQNSNHTDRNNTTNSPTSSKKKKKKSKNPLKSIFRKRKSNKKKKAEGALPPDSMKISQSSSINSHTSQLNKKVENDSQVIPFSLNEGSTLKIRLKVSSYETKKKNKKKKARLYDSTATPTSSSTKKSDKNIESKSTKTKIKSNIKNKDDSSAGDLSDDESIYGTSHFSLFNLLPPPEVDDDDCYNWHLEANNSHKGKNEKNATQAEKNKSPSNNDDLSEFCHPYNFHIEDGEMVYVSSATGTPQQKRGSSKSMERTSSSSFVGRGVYKAARDMSLRLLDPNPQPTTQVLFSSSSSFSIGGTNNSTGGGVNIGSHLLWNYEKDNYKNSKKTKTVDSAKTDTNKSVASGSFTSESAHHSYYYYGKQDSDRDVTDDDTRDTIASWESGKHNKFRPPIMSPSDMNNGLALNKRNTPVSATKRTKKGSRSNRADDDLLSHATADTTELIAKLALVDNPNQYPSTTGQTTLASSPRKYLIPTQQKRRGQKEDSLVDLLQHKSWNSNILS